MGFFSNCCAVSGQSIPAECVEPCLVTAFFPDGHTVTGIYNGYGCVSDCDVRETLRDHFADQREDFDFIEAQVKMVKTKYVTQEMNWHSLPASARCAEQGFFYEHGKPWNKPARSLA